jgi:hypothetical protein
MRRRPPGDGSTIWPPPSQVGFSGRSPLPVRQPHGTLVQRVSPVPRCGRVTWHRARSTPRRELRPVRDVMPPGQRPTHETTRRCERTGSWSSRTAWPWAAGNAGAGAWHPERSGLPRAGLRGRQAGHAGGSGRGTSGITKATGGANLPWIGVPPDLFESSFSVSNPARRPARTAHQPGRPARIVRAAFDPVRGSVHDYPAPKIWSRSHFTIWSNSSRLGLA